MQRSRFQHIGNRKIHYGDHTWTIYGNLRDATALYNQNTGGDWNAPTDGCPGVQCPCDGGWSAPCSCNSNGTISCPSCICETEQGQLQYRAGGMTGRTMSRRSQPRRSQPRRVGHGAGNSSLAYIICVEGGAGNWGQNEQHSWSADCNVISEDSMGQSYQCPRCNGQAYLFT